MRTVGISTLPSKKREQRSLLVRSSMPRTERKASANYLVVRGTKKPTKQV